MSSSSSPGPPSSQVSSAGSGTLRIIGEVGSGSKARAAAGGDVKSLRIRVWLSGSASAPPASGSGRACAIATGGSSDSSSAASSASTASAGTAGRFSARKESQRVTTVR